MAAEVPPALAPFSVNGKTAIITGAGSGQHALQNLHDSGVNADIPTQGINLSFAELLLSRNCNVVIADLSLRPEAQQLVDKHSSKSEGKPRAVFKKTDVVRWDDLAAMFDVAEAEFGGADIVCPGAGVYEPHWSNFWHPPDSSPSSKDTPHGTTTEGLGHYATLDINITHPIRTTQLAIARWLNPPTSAAHQRVSPSNPKRIVHISSVAGQTPGLATPLYMASKHALSGFIRSLAPLDEQLGIRVNGVAPGIIRTPLWTDHPEKLQAVGAVDVWITPEEVAQRMLQCVEDGDVLGGSVMEVLKDSFRSVGWRNDPGPQGPGSTVQNRAVLQAEVFAWLGTPGWGVAKS